MSPNRADCFPIFDVFREPVSSTPPCLFLPDTVDDDDFESGASAANDKWCQNRFNEFLAHINHVPLFPLMFMYSWEELGSNLLPHFFKCLLKKDGTRYPLGSINNLLNACRRILCIHQHSQIPFLLASSLPILPRLNIRMHPLFAHIVACFKAAMRKSVKE